MSSRGYLRSAGLIAVGEAVARLKGLLLIPLLAHAFGEINYGVWSQVVVLVTLVPLFLLLGTDSAVARFLPGADYAEQRRRFWGWTVVVLSAGAVICLVLVVARDPISSVFFGGGSEYSRFIPLAAVSIWISMLLAALRTWVRVRQDARLYAAATAGQALTNLAATAVVVIIGWSLYGLVAATLVADALVAAALLVTIALRYGFARPQFRGGGQLIRFGLPLAPAAFAVWGMNWIDRIFLVNTEDLSVVGRYSLAYSLGYVAIQVIANPLWTMYPTAAAEHWNLGRPAALAQQFRHTAGLTLLLIAPLIAASAVVGDQVIRIVAPPDFADAASVVPLVMAGYLAAMLSSYY